MASALALGEHVRRFDLSPVEIARAYIDRIERYGAELGAFVHFEPELVLREARRCERRMGEPDAPPFLGVPIAIKDLNLAAGYFARMGSRAFERFFAVVDDLTVRRLRRAGFVVLGKTAVSELASLPHAEPAIHPPARNPWDRARSPGGSSGGAGVALAARLAPIAQGSDGGGSIRIPSAFCHVYGIKPSRGRVPNSYGTPDRTLLYTPGPMAHTVDDAAALLDVMAGVTVGRPHWAPPPETSFLELARRMPPRLRVRVATKTPLAETHPDIEAAVLRVADALAAMGHDVEATNRVVWPEARPEDFLVLWKRLVATVGVHDWTLTEPINQWLSSEGKRLTAQDEDAARASLTRAVEEACAGADLLVTPTVASIAPRIDTFRDLEARAAIDRATLIAAFTAGFNVTGQPAASVPAGLTREGLPIGVQIVGPPLADGLVLAISRALEEAIPWADLVPPSLGLS